MRFAIGLGPVFWLYAILVAGEGPYAIAVVELEEGPRMMTNIVHTEVTPENLRLDMPLRVVFEPRGDVHVPLFEPAE